MLKPIVYRETYDIRSHTVVENSPPVYQLIGIFGPEPLTTSPFLTDTSFVGHDRPRLEEYAEKGKELCEECGSDYLLIKTRLPGFAEILRSRYILSDAFVTTVLDLTDGEDALWNGRLMAKTRNQVRKGYKSEPVIKLGKEELLEDFYRVIAITQTDLGTPVHAKRYFRNILNHHSEARLLVLYLSDFPVSAALLLVDGSILYHPYAGTVNKYKSTSINNVLYWEIIKFGAGSGCAVFDMGRSFRESGNARFKRSWGGEEIQLYYCYYLNKAKDLPDYRSRKMQLLTRMWSLLPVGVAKRIGPALIRSVP